MRNHYGDEVINDNLCGCGSVTDAIDVAVKLTNEMFENDCEIWAMQVLTAFVHIRERLVQGFTLGDETHIDNEGLLKLFDLNVKGKMISERKEEVNKLLKQIAQKSSSIGIHEKGLQDEFDYNK